MKIFNSYTNQLEDFKPIDDGVVSMYVCGPTVYNYIHIGNARPIIIFDVLRRFFEYSGYEVKMASNFTDVDDKIIKRAKEEGKSEKEITEFYMAQYLKDCERIGSRTDYVKPKVTEYMEEITDYIKKLVDTGYAYVVDGDVYFRVSKIKEYGQLSNQRTDDLISGARIETNDKKENPLDFTLWKRTSEGIQFDSPFGKGRPGWHTECVAMIEDLFGDRIDIHGGGSDLKFPHHENEIAQSIAYCGTTVANYWMHNGRLNINNEKMSKSEGNVVWVKDIEHPMAFRLFMLSTHYRSPINFSDEVLVSSTKEWNNIETAYKALFRDLELVEGFDQDERLPNVIDSFCRYMENDLGTANVITLLFDLTKLANKVMRGQEQGSKAAIFNTLTEILDVLGLSIHVQRLSVEQRELYLLWTLHKQNKNYEEADKIRVRLKEQGIV